MMPRWYIKFLGGDQTVHTLVGLAPSNHGTTFKGLVSLARAFPGGSPRSQACARLQLSVPVSARSVSSSPSPSSLGCAFRPVLLPAPLGLLGTVLSPASVLSLSDGDVPV